MRIKHTIKITAFILCAFTIISGCGGQSGSSNDTGEDETETIQPIAFDLSNSIGLAIDNSSATQNKLTISSNMQVTEDEETGVESNLKTVGSDGSLKDAISSGSVTVSQFLIQANNVYLLLSGSVDVDEDGKAECFLVRVDSTDNSASCVDESISSIVWNTGARIQNDPIQFDGNGNIYYMFDENDGKRVLRKNASGTTTDLINDNITIEDFLVLSDGTVFITGETTSTSARWIRKIDPSNALENVFTSSTSNFLSLFPDGNVYMGIWETPVFGVSRYLTASNELEDKKWITLDINGLTVPRYFDCEAISANQNFVGWCGSFVRAIHRTTDDKVYVIAGDGAEGVLMQYYPTVSEPTTTVTKVSIAKGVLTNLILAGLDASDNNKLVLFNTTDESEVDLLGSENIEVYQVHYQSSTNRIMFDGLRFSDNKYVICQVDLGNGNALNCTETGTSQLSDFQLFN